VTDRERIHRSGLPARTFEVARQRAVAAGWLLDRFIPDPRIVGRSRAILAIGRPFVEQQAERAHAWERAPGAVLVWQTSQTIFGVFVPPPDRPIGRELDPAAFTRLRTIEIDLTRPSLPVYFDFEGAWARVVGQPGSRTYPKSLPYGAERELARRRVSREEIEALVAAPFAPGDLSSLGTQVLVRLGRSARERARFEPLVARRYLLDPSRLPGYLDWTLGAVVFVAGRLRDGASAAGLFHALGSECQVAPFLFATDDRSVLFATLAPAPAAVRAGAPGGRPSVTAEVARHLAEIEVFREPVGELVAPLNHRYDRLFDPDPAGLSARTVAPAVA
jgi:hypothetical protein